MDELAAAAAAVSMATEANAEDEMGQRGSCVTDNDKDAAMPDVESTTEDKENNSVHAAVANPEDAPSKVSIAPQIPRNTPSAQHSTRPDSTCTHPRNTVRRVGSIP